MSSDLKVQEVFDKVIEAGHYGYSDYMCNALEEAMDEEVITEEECSLAIKAIQEYIHPESTLFGALVIRGEQAINSAYANKLRIYKNWAERPQLKD